MSNASSENSIEDLIGSLNSGSGNAGGRGRVSSGRYAREKEPMREKEPTLGDVMQCVSQLEARVITMASKVSELDRNLHKSLIKHEYGRNYGTYFEYQKPASTRPQSRRSVARSQVQAAQLQMENEFTSTIEVAETYVPVESPATRLRRAVGRLSVVKRVKEKREKRLLTEAREKEKLEREKADRDNREKDKSITEAAFTGPASHKEPTDLKDLASPYFDDENVATPMIFLPDGPFRLVWDCIYMLIASWEVMLWSLVVFSTYGDEPSLRNSDTLLTVRVVTSFFWLVDIFVQMRTAKLQGWEIIEEEEVLRNEFMQGWMIFDGVITIPFDLALAIVGKEMLSYHFMAVRVLRLIRIPYLFGHSTPTRETSRTIESIHFSFWLLIIMHICSCVWIRTATQEEQAVADDEVNDLYTVYSKSFYFIWTTLSSVGYGDISPKTNSMRAYNIFLQWLGLAVIMVVSGRTGAYFITTDPYKLAQLDRKRRLEHLMSNANVPWALQKEAFTIYPSLLDASTKDYQSMLLELPDFIQGKISNHIKLNLIRGVPMFNNISKRILVHLADVLEEVYYGSKEYLIRAGDVGEEMYFLNHGMVDVLLPSLDDPSKEIWAATLKSGSWFGEIALLRRTTRIASIRSVTSCVLYKLNTADFDNVVRSSEELRKRLQEETDKRVRQNDEVKEATLKQRVSTTTLRTGVVGSIAVDMGAGPAGVLRAVINAATARENAHGDTHSISPNTDLASASQSVGSGTSSKCDSPRSATGSPRNPLVASKRVWASDTFQPSRSDSGSVSIALDDPGTK